VFPARCIAIRDLCARRPRIKTAKDPNKRTNRDSGMGAAAGVYVRGFLAETMASTSPRSSGCRRASISLAAREGCAQSAEADFAIGAAEASLSSMLGKRRIDAAITARAPDAFIKGDAR